MSTSETPSPDSPPGGGSAWAGRLLTLLLLAAIGGGVWYFGPGLTSLFASTAKQGDPSVVNSKLVTAPVKVGLFESVLNVQGNLDSQSNATLTSQVEGTTTIISIVPEGTWVEEGQIVVELDSSELTENVKQQEIDVTQAKAKLAQAREELEIQETQNASDIAAAKLAWELAVLDLEKYEEGEYPASQKELAGIVAIADEDYLRATDEYTYTQKMVGKGFKTPTDLEAARIAVKGKRLELEKAREDLKVLTEYTRKREIAELEANAAEYKREWDRTELKAKSAYAQAKAEVDSADLTLQVEEEKLERTRRQLEACIIKAPQPGEVVYATESSSRGRSEGAAIEEGASVRQRQAIINLPDVTKMKVDCKIHESLIGQVRVGLPATIRIDAYPDRVFNGRVSTVSSVPMSGSWPNYDLREYALEIGLTDDPEVIRELRPGLTAQVSIIADRRDGVLQVPVQAVVKAGRETLAFAMGDRNVPDMRLLKVGGTNATAAEIIDGLVEGERVVLNPRSHFAAEIASVERSQKTPGEDKPESDSPEETGASRTPGDQGQSDGGDAASGRGGERGGRPSDGDQQGGESRGGDAADGQQRRGGDPEAAFKRFDTNGDGSLTKDEAPSFLSDRFDEMDADSDGSVTAAEFAKAVQSMRRAG